MKNILTVIFLIASFSKSVSQSSCDIKGNWQLTGGRIFENYEMAAPYSSNRITFDRDTIELASGFFYQTDDLIDNYPVGRYPFVYYGNKELYKISSDSVSFYSSPYKVWKSFKMCCIKPDKLKLIGKVDTLTLIKSKALNRSKACSIKYIKAHVYGPGDDVDIFKVNYRVTLSNDDKLLFENLSPHNDYKRLDFSLKRGTFNDICSGLDTIDLRRLKPIYSSEISEIGTIQLEIEKDGTIYRSELQNDDYPDALRLALIPVLYLHQQLVYPELRPVK